MGKTLAELRAMTAPKLPSFPKRLCLNQELLAQVQRLVNESRDLLIEAERQHPKNADGEPAGPRKAAERVVPARVEEIDRELGVLYDQMREYEGELLLKAIDGVAWQEFKDEHPPREGHVTDQQVGYGLVNTTAVMAELRRWAHSWDGEELLDSDWEGWLRGRIAPGDLSDLVKDVVRLQEQQVNLPKAETPSSTTPSPENGADSPSS